AGSDRRVARAVALGGPAGTVAGDCSGRAPATGRALVGMGRWWAAAESVERLAMLITPLPEVTKPGRLRAAVSVMAPPVALVVETTPRGLLRTMSRPESIVIEDPAPVAVTLALMRTPSPAGLVGRGRVLLPPEGMA